MTIFYDGVHRIAVQRHHAIPQSFLYLYLQYSKSFPYQKYIFDMGKTLSIGDIDIESFGVSHDAAEPQFYELHHKKSSFAIVTDTGYVSENIARVIKDAEAYLFECNHDTEMLRM